jgi:hypothetical protein
MIWFKISGLPRQLLLDYFYATVKTHRLEIPEIAVVEITIDVVDHELCW